MPDNLDDAAINIRALRVALRRSRGELHALTLDVEHVRAQLERGLELLERLACELAEREVAR